uniref:SFRICE_002530 n=1 Tax=Spodoptera frugiperda TaxID=7108 RepID=A0A2H1WCW7_SPOFR
MEKMKWTFGILLLLGVHMYFIKADNAGLYPPSEELNDEQGGDDDVCDCPRTKRLVCGTDGVTYFNLCSLICASDKDPSIAMRYLGRCSIMG